MPNYKRAMQKGGMFFFTVVTHGRRKFLTREPIRRILGETIAAVREKYPFIINAWVLLPDHFHCIWTLPKTDSDYSLRMGLIKSGFSKKAKFYFRITEPMSESKIKHRETALWQRRFWEHKIRDEKDLHAQMDYIHYNPVKHGVVKSAANWPFSTFHRYVNAGVYNPTWGGKSVSGMDLDVAELTE